MTGRAAPAKTRWQWAEVEDLRATDGARCLRMRDATGNTLATIEVMEMARDIDQAKICAAMAKLLTDAAPDELKPTVMAATRVDHAARVARRGGK